MTPLPDGTQPGDERVRGLPPVAPVPPFVAAFLMREIPSSRWREAIVGARATNPVLAAQYEQTVAYLRAGQVWWLGQIEAASASGSAEAGLAEVAGDLGRPSSLGTTEVGRRLGFTSRWVRKLIDDKILRADLVGRSWAIDSDSVEEYLMRRSA